MFIFLDTKSELILIKNKNRDIHSKLWLWGALLIFACYLPWMLMNYPGSAIPDAVMQIAQFYGDYKFSAHHPPLSTYIFGAFLELGDFVWDKAFGLFLYLLFQGVLAAFIYAYGIFKLHESGIRLRYCIVALLFFAITPMWGSYYQSLEKDVLYTEIVTLFHIILINTVVKKNFRIKDSILLVITGILAALLRKNGIYTVLPALFVLLFYLQKEFRKRIWPAIATILVIYCTVTKFIYPVVLNIEGASIKEALSLPFEQTACYVSRYGDDVTDKEREVIDAFLDYDSLAEVYNPTNADPVKATYKGNMNLTFERLKGLVVYAGIWAEMFFKHPDAYISAAFNMSYGYIAPVGERVGAEIKTHYDTQMPYLAELGMRWKNDSSLADMFILLQSSVSGTPIAHFFIKPGLYTWIMMVAGLIIIRKKRYRELIIFIPWVVNLLVCIASPLGNSMRYALPVAAGAPLMIGWAVYLAYDDSSSLFAKEKR